MFLSGGMMSLPVWSHVPSTGMSGPKGWGCLVLKGGHVWSQGGGGGLVRGVWSQGVWYYPACEQTNMCKNITLSQRRLRVVRPIVDVRPCGPLTGLCTKPRDVLLETVQAAGCHSWPVDIFQFHGNGTRLRQEP